MEENSGGGGAPNLRTDRHSASRPSLGLLAAWKCRMTRFVYTQSAATGGGIVKYKPALDGLRAESKINNGMVRFWT
jgi:hypothetical protein